MGCLRILATLLLAQSCRLTISASAANGLVRNAKRSSLVVDAEGDFTEDSSHQIDADDDFTQISAEHAENRVDMSVDRSGAIALEKSAADVAHFSQMRSEDLMSEIKHLVQQMESINATCSL